MRRIPGPPYAVAGGLAVAVVLPWVVFFVFFVFFAVRGENDQSRQAQASMPLPACPPPGTDWPRECQRLEGLLAPRQQGYDSGFVTGSGPSYGFPLPLDDARVVAGDTVRYVVKSEYPANALARAMSHFLWNFRFGVRGRPMRVHLRDGQGHVVWSARYDGVENMGVSARAGLEGCGPISYAKTRTVPGSNPPGDLLLPNASGARQAPPCPLVSSGLR